MNKSDIRNKSNASVHNAVLVSPPSIAFPIWAVISVVSAYGMGSTRWQTIYKIVLPASASGIFSGIILGLARAFVSIVSGSL